MRYMYTAGEVVGSVVLATTRVLLDPLLLFKSTILLLLLPLPAEAFLLPTPPPPSFRPLLHNTLGAFRSCAVTTGFGSKKLSSRRCQRTRAVLRSAASAEGGDGGPDEIATPPRDPSAPRSGGYEDDPDAGAGAPMPPPPFRWGAEWYPLAPVRDLRRDGPPNKLTLLGTDLAVWYDAPADAWRAFADACPHRLVPLTEGRVETGTGRVQCAYHGWEFDGGGNCVRIPQLEPDRGTTSSSSSSPPVIATAAVGSRRACVSSFPVRVEQGLLWVFPTADEAMAASAKGPALIPQLDDDDKLDATNFFVRDMPYSWDVLVENLCDPSHIPFAHHGVMGGADRGDVEGIDVEVVEETPRGFRARKDPYPSGSGRYDVKFEPPCLLYYEIVDENARSYIGLGQYCVPTSPGRCRILARFPFRLDFGPAMRIIRATPRWITHLSQNVVMDSDVVFLSSQDERLELDRERRGMAGGRRGALPDYYMPSRCDAMVTAFRTWLERHGGGGPSWLGVPASRSSGLPLDWWRPRRVPAREGRDALLDRYRQHTEVCSSCRRAHGVMYRVGDACVAAGVCLLAAAAAAAGAAGPVGGRKTSLAVLGAALLLAPRVLLRPLIARLECVPWPRKKWARPTSVESLPSSHT